MKSLLNELLIKWYLWRGVHAKTADTRIFYLMRMVEHIKRRDGKQIERMERARGLR